MKDNCLKLINAIFFVSIFSACSTSTTDIPENYELENESGIVIVSLTSSGECGYAMFADFRGLTLNRNGSFGFQNMFQKREWTRSGSECTHGEGFDGTLRIVSLPEGIYEIHTLSRINRYNAFSTDKDFNVRFTVTRESITYLGNLHFDIRENTFSYDILDKSKRDLEVFEKRHPHLEGQYIIDILQYVE